jgi:TetR/AcrR family transcriptional repressor of bet genes
MSERRPYRREAEDIRREALIAAALDLIAEGGQKSATVRAIADRAGVTPGLIRHYFASKEELTRAAYRHMMDRMNGENAEVLEAGQHDPRVRLAAFVTASLRPPVMDPERVGLWAGFLHDVRRDPQMKAIHESTYFAYRDLLQSLIADLPRPADAARLRADAIACNAVIDGLWLEGSVLPERFGPRELETIGLASVGAILGVTLPVPDAIPARL